MIHFIITNSRCCLQLYLAACECEYMFIFNDITTRQWNRRYLKLIKGKREKCEMKEKIGMRCRFAAILCAVVFFLYT